MHIKIYFDEKPLFLCDSIDPEIEPFAGHAGTVRVDELDAQTVKLMTQQMQQPLVHAGIFLHPDLAELKKEFFRKFQLIRAGGGLVKNEVEENLLIFRRKLWDLPKGKLDKGETIEDCAIREVEEETGLRNITLGSPLMITYHTYHHKGAFVMKESHWYHMRVSGQQQLTPQTEEDIEEIRWVNATNLEPYLRNAFPSVIDVLRLGGALTH